MDIKYKSKTGFVENRKLREMVGLIMDTSLFINSGFKLTSSGDMIVSVDLIKSIKEFREEVRQGDYPTMLNTDMRDIDVLLDCLEEVKKKGFEDLYVMS